MSGQHTQGRLKAIHGSWIVTEDGNVQIARGASFGPHVENTLRLAACWNACEGIDTDMLKPDMLIDTLTQVTELATERDQLRAERDAERAVSDSMNKSWGECQRERDAARALLRDILAGAPHLVVGMQCRIRELLGDAP